MSDASFTILTVCTANLCRSPMAEAIINDQLTSVRWPEPWSVSSSGTMVGAASDMHPLARMTLAERHIAPSPWQITPITAGTIATADLILTAEIGHRRAVVSLYPGAVRRTFTLLRFAELAEAASRSGAVSRCGADLIQHCLVASTKSAPGQDHLYDLRDPIGGDASEFRTCADLIQKSVAQIFRLAPTEPTSRDSTIRRPRGSEATAGQRHRV